MCFASSTKRAWSACPAPATARKHMSAKLIKGGRQTAADAFIRFAMPSDGRSEATASAYGFMTAKDIPAITAENEAEPIIARARALAAEIENDARQNSS